MLGVLDIMTATGYLAIILAVVPPIVGTGVRYRVHYNPRDIQRDSEGEEQPHTGPLVSSFFGMLRRVYRIEGWAGIYKGLIPMLLMTTLFLLIFYGTNFLIKPYSVTDAVVVVIFSCSVVVILFLPLTVITNRAITTPHKLPYFNAMYSLRVLLTPAERRRPWILYCTPGFLAAQVARVVCIALVMGSILLWILPEHENLKILFFAKVFAVACLGKVVVLPLDVIATRLSIQRNHGTPEYNPLIAQDVNDGEEVVEHASASEDVICLRTDREPYVSLIDCAKKVVDEEGWSALYRVWWLSTF